MTPMHVRRDAGVIWHTSDLLGHPSVVVFSLSLFVRGIYFIPIFQEKKITPQDIRIVLLHLVSLL